jgi:ATP-dependent DNA helicase RecG
MIPKAESLHIEFKTTFSDEVIITLVAFSNAKGGSVYIGVTDKAEVKGVDIGKETIQNWVNEVKNKTSPQIIPDAEVIDMQEKTVIVFSVTEYPIKPVSLKGRFYKRNGNSNHLMTIDEIANEHLKTINTSWDFYIDPNHTTDEISFDKVSRFIHKIEQRTQSEIQIAPQEFLSKMEIIREGKLTFGGFLLFVTDYCLISDIQVCNSPQISRT